VPLIVRQTQHDDVDAILQIKQEPKVARHQYRVDIREYSDHIQRVLRGDNKTGVITSQFMTIAKDCEVIGYLRQDHYSVDGIKYLSCGWNLTSAYWGQGVMRFALTHLLNQWIFELEIQHVFAEYFRTNLRCARLLDRLAFATQEIPIVERLSTAWQLRCLQWVVRRRLDAETWKLQDGSSFSGTESTEICLYKGRTTHYNELADRPTLL
jgi:RimJ/RimL family protein N-acetyltransferase